jgi:hypothetical protein
MEKCCFSCDKKENCDNTCVCMTENCPCEAVRSNGVEWVCCNWEGLKEDTEDGFIKHDTGKLRYDLLPFEQLDKVVSVITKGAVKYTDDNWKKGGHDALKRYKAALGRHYSSMMQGEIIDPESGEPHTAHIACNSLFIMYLEEKLKNARD